MPLYPPRIALRLWRSYSRLWRSISATPTKKIWQRLCLMGDKTVRIISSPSEKTPARCGNVLATILLKNEIRTKQVICKIYKTLLEHSGSTTNIKTHLSRHHPTHSTTTNTAKRNESTYHSQNLIKTTVESNRKKSSQQTLEDCIKKTGKISH